MKFIRSEQQKLEPKKKPKPKPPAPKKQRDLPDDSVSEITDLEEEEILARYYKERLTAAEARALKRKKGKLADKQATKDRLGGAQAPKHVCKTTHRPPNAYELAKL